jgi:hypothetical protein
MPDDAYTQDLIDASIDDRGILRGRVLVEIRVTAEIGDVGASCVGGVVNLSFAV